MTTMTWNARELPILDAIAAVDDDTGRAVTNEAEIAAIAGLSDSQAEAGLRSLLGADMIEGIDTTSFSGFGLLEIRLREKGRRACGQWPSGDVSADLLAALGTAVEQTEDEVERSGLKKLREDLNDISKDVLSSILTAVIRSQTGL